MLTKRQAWIALSDPRRAVRGAKFRVQNLRLKGRLDPNSVTFARDARPGQTAEMFRQITDVPGWFTYDDAAHFSLALRVQSALGVRGDILEIGSYHGRSTAFLAACLQDGEVLTVCDPFQIGDVYVEDPPTPDGLRRNVARAVPGFDQAQLEVREAYSTDLDLGDERRFRFVHVDGSHLAPDVLHDLRLAHRHLAPGGIIVADDYQHPDWPGVTEAVGQFLAEATDLIEVADLNRHAESGRKLYLTRPVTVGASTS